MSESTLPNNQIVGLDVPVLVTGAPGFIGTRVVEGLLSRGFREVRCFARPSSDTRRLEAAIERHPTGGSARILRGNLLSPRDCAAAVEGVGVVFHLAAVRGEKSFAEAFRNSVVTTRNLVEASLQNGRLRRFVTVSSFTVYTNADAGFGRVLDENSPVENHPESRDDVYCYAKVKEEELIWDYVRNRSLPGVIVRPGAVYGPGNEGISGRIGIDSFGIYLHLGGSNPIPFTYVENCSEAIVLAGLVAGIDGEVYNVVDDDVPTSRQFLSLYKRQVRPLRTIYLPKAASYLMCWGWELLAKWSRGQLPAFLNRRGWQAAWRKTRYSNAKLKRDLGWIQAVPTQEALQRHFQACRAKFNNA